MLIDPESIDPRRPGEVVRRAAGETDRRRVLIQIKRTTAPGAHNFKMEEMESLLAGLPLFAPVAGPALRRLARTATAIAASRGTVLFRRGDPCSGMHAVISGRVKLALPAESRLEKVIALPGPGDTFGEAALLLDAGHMLSAETVSDAELLHIDKSALLAHMARDAGFACRLSAALSARVRALVCELESATLRSGTQRVIRFILSELEREACADPTAITLPAKKRVIASRLDLTHEHFSRILHDLVVSGLITVDGPRVNIRNMAKLRLQA